MPKNTKARKSQYAFKTAKQTKNNPTETLEHLGAQITQFYQAGRIQDALKVTQQALIKYPDNVALLSNAGAFSLMLTDLELAEHYLFKTLHLDPNNAQIYYRLAYLFEKQNLLDNAVEYYKKALEINANFPQVYNNLAGIFKNKKQFDQAEKYYQIAIKINPNYAIAHHNLAFLLATLKQSDKAREHYTKALEINPNFVDAYINLANLFKDQGQFDQAEENYQAGLKIDPNNLIAHNNLGLILTSQRNFDEANKHYQKILEINPDFVEAYSNLANLFMVQKQFNKAIDYYEKVLALDLNHMDARWNLSLLQLNLLNLKQGWQNYESRSHKNKKHRVAIPPNTSISQYQNEILDIAGKRLFICPEQGIGDGVMFASVLFELEAQTQQNSNTHIILACDPRLVALFTRSFNFLTVIAKEPTGRYQIIENNVDNWLFIGSLAKYYRHRVEDFYQHHPYLKVDNSLLSKWQDRLSQLSHNLNIGISWVGGTKVDNKKSRSLTLEQLTPILAKINQSANIINLQYGDHNQDIRYFSVQTGIPIHDWDDADPLKDLDNFAAQIKALDLVISIDNSTVHFSGALGVDTWVMLPFNQDWRWAEEREDSYWYPNTMQLFRQKEVGNWDKVIQDVTDSLNKILDSNMK